MSNETRLVVVLVQLVLVMVAARVFGELFRRMKQPVVVGEIFAGLVLGPSVLGKLETWAGWANHPISTTVFNHEVADVFGVLSQLGLILLLFMVGLEFEFSHLRQSHRSALSISVAGVLLPFGLGWVLAHLIHPYVGGAGPDGTIPIDRFGFSLFLGTAMSITALPILGRIMMEMEVTRTRLAAITISAAAIDDVTGWILLATVSALVKAQFQWLATLRMIGLTVGFALVMIFLVRPLLGRWIAWAMRNNPTRLDVNALAILLVVVFLCAVATSEIGIFAIFGAFTLGGVLSDQHEFRRAVTRQLQTFVTVFFLPIFFTYTGLRTDVGSLSTGTLWLIAGAVAAAAIVGKFVGCATAARLNGLSWRESLCVGTMMNTRALMELIVINVGYDLRVIPHNVFCMLVMMAVLTTLMTAPLLHLFKEGTELDHKMRRLYAAAVSRLHGRGAWATLPQPTAPAADTTTPAKDPL